MILDSILAGTILFTSFTMRTPNVLPNPDDYQFSIGVDNPYFYLKRDWERELGTKYIDDLVWGKLEGAGIYFKPEYMNKQSKGVKYLKLDWRKTWIGATWGFTTRSTNDALDEYETFASVGINRKKKHGENIEVEISFDGYLPPNEDGEAVPSLSTIFDNFEYEDKFSITYKISEKVSIYNTGEFYSLQDKTFYKAKIGINWRF